MSQNKMQHADKVKEQYENTGNLDIRIAIHQKYSTNQQPFADWIYENYRFSPGDQILELGCGTGDMWVGKVDGIGKGSKLYLTDFSQAMVDSAEAKLGDYPQVTVSVMNAQQIEASDSSYDVVIANMMLYHMPDLSGCLKEIRRVLKPGGTFYCATFGENSVHSFVEDVITESGIPIKGEMNKAFTLQNGGVQLARCFDSVKVLKRDDALQITCIADLAAYIRTMENLFDYKDLEDDLLEELLKKQMDAREIITIPKEYGTFICT